jgi:hypothetical protein
LNLAIILLVLATVSSVSSQNNTQSLPSVGKWSPGEKTTIVSIDDTCFWADGAILRAGKFTKGKLEYQKSVAVGSQINDLLLVNKELFVATSHHGIQVYQAQIEMEWAEQLGDEDSYILELEYNKDYPTLFAIKYNEGENDLGAIAWEYHDKNIRFDVNLDIEYSGSSIFNCSSYYDSSTVNLFFYLLKNEHRKNKIKIIKFPASGIVDSVAYDLNESLDYKGKNVVDAIIHRNLAAKKDILYLMSSNAIYRAILNDSLKNARPDSMVFFDDSLNVIAGKRLLIDKQKVYGIEHGNLFLAFK